MIFLYYGNTNVAKNKTLGLQNVYVYGSLFSNTESTIMLKYRIHPKYLQKFLKTYI